MLDCSTCIAMTRATPRAREEGGGDKLSIHDVASDPSDQCWAADPVWVEEANTKAMDGNKDNISRK
jgi:hypothetical protein